MEDVCQQCIDERRAYRCSEAGQAELREWRTGVCEWCQTHVMDLRDARDYEEGMSGRVYRVCGACIRRQNDEAYD
jgi:DNA-binding PadR family transcriptional regulator